MSQQANYQLNFFDHISRIRDKIKHQRRMTHERIKRNTPRNRDYQLC